MKTLLGLVAALLCMAPGLAQEPVRGRAAAPPTTWVVDRDQFLAAEDAQHEGVDVEVRAGTLRVEGAHAFNRLTVAPAAGVWLGSALVRLEQVMLDPGASLHLAGGATLAVSGDLELRPEAVVNTGVKDRSGLVDGAWRGVGVRIEAGSLAMGSGSVIRADGEGYPGSDWRSLPGRGPGGGRGGGDLGAGSGGGHGALGGRPRSRPEMEGGAVYDSPLWPLEPGSGGGGGYPDAAHGGDGGGAVHVVVRGAFEFDGRISANGSAAPGSLGGGSGGSILVEAGTLSGSGVFVAEGGLRGPDGGGSGAGGRIAVYADVNRLTNPSGSSVKGGEGAEDGTLVFVDRTVPGLGLEVWHRWALEGGTESRFGRVRVHEGGRWVMGEDARVGVGGEVEVESGGEVRMGGGAWLGVTNAFSLRGSNAVVWAETRNRWGQFDGRWQAVGVTLEAGSLAMGSGSVIRADGEGYPGSDWRSQPGRGPGGGRGGGDLGAGSGGGHGALGGRPRSRPEMEGGAVYDSPLWPLEPGSGGGGGYPDAAHGGDGGGAVHVVVRGAFEFDGRISANGTGAPGSLGGGSGGSILVEAGTLSGSGVFVAEGGLRGPDGGGSGAGGRIAVYADVNRLTNPSGSSVKGGEGAEDGTLVFVDRTVPGLGLEVWHRWGAGGRDGVEVWPGAGAWGWPVGDG